MTIANRVEIKQAELKVVSSSEAEGEDASSKPKKDYNSSIKI